MRIVRNTLHAFYAIHFSMQTKTVSNPTPSPHPDAARVRHGGASRYRSYCPCCVDDAEVPAGKPQRRVKQRPVLPWRLRADAAV